MLLSTYSDLFRDISMILVMFDCHYDMGVIVRLYGPLNPLFLLVFLPVASSSDLYFAITCSQVAYICLALSSSLSN